MRFLTFTTLFVALASGVFATGSRVNLGLQVKAPNGNIDDASIYFDQGIQPTFVAQEDAQKVLTVTPGVPLIYTVSTDQVACLKNGFGTYSNTEVVPVGCDVDADGLYVFELSTLDNLPATSIIRLEDRTAGTFTDMRTSSYSAQINANDPATGRFYLHVAIPAQVSATDAGCQNDNGTITIQQDNSASWDAVKLLDQYNNVVATLNNVTGQFDFTALTEGDYYIVYMLGNYSTTEPIHVRSNYVTAYMFTSAQEVLVGQNIEFSALATNANQYNWDFGDGTIITGVANPTISYYQPGTYTVNLIASNSNGCSDNAQAIINVSSVSGIEDEKLNDAIVYSSGNTITLNMNGVEVKDGEIQVYNLIGQSVTHRPINAQVERVTVNANTGYYLVAVRNAGAVTTKRVFIGN